MRASAEPPSCFTCVRNWYIWSGPRIEPPTKLYTDFSDVIRYVPFDKKTPNAIVGDATIGTREKGEKIVNKCVDRIVEYMNFEFK